MKTKSKPPTKEELKQAKAMCKKLGTDKTPEELLKMSWSKFIKLCIGKSLMPGFTPIVRPVYVPKHKRAK